MIGRCYVPLLKNVKTFAFWGKYDKGYYCNLMMISNYWKSGCAGDFWLVFELSQLFKSIDKSSWDSSKTSQKSPAQSTFPV